MKNRNNHIVRRARALVGSRFRAQGRDPATGLDCVGVILSAFSIPAEGVARDYRLRGPHRSRIEAALLARFRRVSSRDKRCGDVLLCAAAADQIHLAIDCGGSFVHADAKLRAVVETPGEPKWPVVAVYRLRTHAARRS